MRACSTSNEQIINNDKFINKALAMPTLIKAGLTPKHLKYAGWFNSDEHIAALAFYIVHNKADIEQALRVLEDTSKWQAHAISKGISRNEVIGLNDAQLKVRVKLRQFGVSSELLRASTWFNSEEQARVLIRLVKNDHCHVRDALESLKGLSKDGLALMPMLCETMALQEAEGICRKIQASWQVIEISKGSDSSLVLSFDNKYQFTLYQRGKEHGLEKAEVLRLNWFNSPSHLRLYNKLCHRHFENIRDYTCMAEDELSDELVAGEKVKSIRNVLRLIDGTTPLQAELMYKYGYSKNEVAQLNSFQAKAVLEIRQPKLGASVMKQQGWLDSQQKLDTLKYVIRDPRFSVNVNAYENVCNLFDLLSTYQDDDFERVFRENVQVKQPARPDVDVILHFTEYVRRRNDNKKCVLQ